MVLRSMEEPRITPRATNNYRLTHGVIVADTLPQSGSLAIFGAIRRTVSSLLLLFCAGNGWRLSAGSARRRPNVSPGIGCLLIGNLAGRRFVIVVELLLAFLFFGRHRIAVVDFNCAPIHFAALRRLHGFGEVTANRSA